MEIKLQLPKFPNFLRLGIVQDGMIAVGDVPESEIEELAQRWAEGFIEHARKKRTEAAHTPLITKE